MAGCGRGRLTPVLLYCKAACRTVTAPICRAVQQSLTVHRCPRRSPPPPPLLIDLLYGHRRISCGRPSLCCCRPLLLSPDAAAHNAESQPSSGSPTSPPAGHLPLLLTLLRVLHLAVFSSLPPPASSASERHCRLRPALLAPLSHLSHYISAPCSPSPRRLSAAACGLRHSACAVTAHHRAADLRAASHTRPRLPYQARPATDTHRLSAVVRRLSVLRHLAVAVLRPVSCHAHSHSQRGAAACASLTSACASAHLCPLRLLLRLVRPVHHHFPVSPRHLPRPDQDVHYSASFALRHHASSL